MLTKLIEEEIRRVLDLLKAASMVNVDTFIEQATKIADKVKRNPNLSVKAKRDARVLLGQLEEYLEARGLNAADSPRATLARTANEEQPIDVLAI